MISARRFLLRPSGRPAPERIVAVSARPPLAWNGFGRRKRWILLLATLATTLVFTLLPFSFDARHLARRPLWLAFEYPALWEPLLNILLFVPMGFAGSVMAATSAGRLRGAIRGVLIGAGLSLAVESLQMFLPRTPSVLDVIVNTVGAGVGAIFFLWFAAAKRWQRAVAIGAAALLLTVFLLYPLSAGPVLYGCVRGSVPGSTMEPFIPVVETLNRWSEPTRDAYFEYLRWWYVWGGGNFPPQ